MSDATDRLSRIRDARSALERSGPRQERRPGDRETVSLSRTDADVLRDVLADEGVTSVIEIGLAYGTSALAIQEALALSTPSGGRHVIIDAYQDEFHDVGWTELRDAALDDRCELLRARSQLALPRLIEEGVVADAAFVDGSHIFHNVFVDLHFLRELVQPGGLVVLDDCQWPSVATAAAYFQRNTGWRSHPLAGQTRLRAFRLPDPPVEPAFADFTPF